MTTLTLKRPMAGWRTPERAGRPGITELLWAEARVARARRYIERTALRGHAVVWRRVVMGGGRALGG